MNSLAKFLGPIGLKNQRAFHSSSFNLAWSKPTSPKSFLQHNKKVFPPQQIGEDPRPAVSQDKYNHHNRFSPYANCRYCWAWTPSHCEKGKAIVHQVRVGRLHKSFRAIIPCRCAFSSSWLPSPFKDSGKWNNDTQFVCHQKTNFKYSPKKLWYIASFVRGMTVDEAIKQLSFVPKKGAIFVKETILEAQELAVKEHNVEFRSNLWIAESFAGKGMCIKGVRRHARKRMGEVRYMYSHYFVRLEEGKPPADYYNLNPLTPEQQIDKWLEQMRRRKITNSY